MKFLWNDPNLNQPRASKLFMSARLLVLIFMLACIGWFTAGVFEFPRYAASHPGEFIPYAPPWTPEIFSQILGQFGWSIAGWLLFNLVLSIPIALVFWIVGFLIYFRKGNRSGSRRSKKPARWEWKAQFK